MPQECTAGLRKGTQRVADLSRISFQLMTGRPNLLRRNSIAALAASPSQSGLLIFS